MILGHLSLSAAQQSSGMLSRAVGISSFEENSFQKVILKGFEGGYFLSFGLPYKDSDFIFMDEGKDIMVLLSGAVYNREHLYKQLKVLSPIPDPELIGMLFLRGGPDFVKDLNGDFAIVIHQPDAKQSFIFRDHLGIRPVAIASEEQSILFSSDIIGLSWALSGGKSIDPGYLLKHFKYTDLRKGPWKGVTKLPPGHYLKFSESGVTINSYWTPGNIKVNRKLEYNTMLAELKSIVSDAVKIRCDTAFTAGAHVTGGLDSGIVSLLAHREYCSQERFYGFSWSPEDYLPEKEIKYDERELINRSYTGTGVTVVYASIPGNQFLRYIDDYYFNQGYFSEDKSSDIAAQSGTNLIFSGWGGDEFISTGDRGIDIDLLCGLRLKTFIKRNPVNKPGKFIRHLLFYVIYPACGILDRDTARSFRNEARYLKRRYKRSAVRSIKTFYFYRSRRQLHLRLLQHYHLQDRCESWFVNGYRKGVEYRYPLLDNRIIEFMIALPSEFLCRTHSFRPLLREIGADVLPREIIMHQDKTDPVYWRYINSLFDESAAGIMGEVESWKSNHDLFFIDFQRLSDDIKKYRQNPGLVDRDTLSRSVVYLKALHEFTLKYREAGDDK